MPDVHRPHLDDEEDPTPDADAARPRPAPGDVRHRSKSLMKIVLEVLLIGTGVFLGLMGEQWRERNQHRELAQASLERFRTELRKNRAELMRVQAYHVALQKELKAFFDSGEPMTLKRFGQQVHVTAGIEPVSLERTAWDLAVTTGALAYIDPQLAFALSHLYTGQQGITDQQRMIVQSAIYGRSWDADFYGTMRSISFYFNDIRILEPALLGQYDDVLPRIDRALGEPAAQSTKPQ